MKERGGVVWLSKTFTNFCVDFQPVAVRKLALVDQTKTQTTNGSPFQDVFDFPARNSKLTLPSLIKISHLRSPS